MLPFILGLLGMFYQYQRGKQGKKDFWVVMLLFFFTGIAIVLYLNQYPYQPRERDYAYAGSFYAFAIWIGFGVLYLWDLLQKKMDSRNAAIIVTAVCLFAVPVNMAAQNWDDHDRDGRYATIAHAKNYLSSCAPNAILFTYGDNDTFPLWYAQEVEGFRRDVRIVNLSLLAGDWYIDQMKRKAYESDGVPISFTKDQYHAGVRDFVTIEERVQQPFSMKEVMEFVASDRPETKSNRYQGGAVDFIPTRNLYIPVDKEKVLVNGTVQPEDSALIVDRVEIQLKGNSLTKSQLMVLDILATNNWERKDHSDNQNHADAVVETFSAAIVKEFFSRESLIGHQNGIYRQRKQNMACQRQAFGNSIGNLWHHRAEHTVLKPCPNTKRPAEQRMDRLMKQEGDKLQPPPAHKAGHPDPPFAHLPSVKHIRKEVKQDQSAAVPQNSDGAQLYHTQNRVRWNSRQHTQYGTEIPPHFNQHHTDIQASHNTHPEETEPEYPQYFICYVCLCKRFLPVKQEETR